MDYMKTFEGIVKAQLERVERLKNEQDFTDYQSLERIVIGVIGGDGIGPAITDQAKRVLEHLLKADVQKGKVEINVIDGLTIENRAACGKAIPDDVLEEIKKCNVLLKGPTTTPRKGDKWANIKSTNVTIRKKLDLSPHRRRPPPEGNRQAEW